MIAKVAIISYDYMLKKIRAVTAGIVFILCTLLFLDFTGLAAGWFGFLAKIQFLPAGLDPRSRACKLSKKDCDKIVLETRRILQGATHYGGTTIRSYTSSLGVTGRFQLHLKVHDQIQCKVCHHAIKKITVSQRGTYLCPKCQKRK